MYYIYINVKKKYFLEEDRKKQPENVSYEIRVFREDHLSFYDSFIDKKIVVFLYLMKVLIKILHFLLLQINHMELFK